MAESSGTAFIHHLLNYDSEYLGIAALLGKTLTEVKRVGCDEIYFTTSDGETFKMYHSQDCCESVAIDDIEGDLQPLVGNPILVAEEATNNDKPKSETFDDYTFTDESYTWTFYKLATIKGHVDIRWYGSSNGYYSESVDFVKAAPCS